MERTIALTPDDLALLDQMFQQVIKIADLRSVKLLCVLHTKIDAQLVAQAQAPAPAPEPALVP